MVGPISSATTTVVQGTNNASFDRVPVETQQDFLDISITDTPSESAPVSGPGTYGPDTFDDKFKFDLQNGMLDPSKRFNALSVRFDLTAVSTYETRQNLAAQIGVAGPQAALFALHYQAANPDLSDASTNVDARTTENRRIDRGLDLLNLLGSSGILALS